MPAFPRLDWSRLQPSRNPWHLAGISAAVGFLLFLIVWLSSLGDDDNATAQTAQESARDNLALPVPLTDGQSVSHMQQPRFPQEAVATDPQATPTESLPDPLAEPPSDPAAASPPIAATTTSNPSAAPAAGTTTLPVPIQGQTPAPEYPADAMRNNSSGTVMLRVKVSTEGVPDEVEVIERSGDRSLDRAAALAIRQWRFTPAQQDGKAVTGSIDIPISFNLEK